MFDAKQFFLYKCNLHGYRFFLDLYLSKTKHKAERPQILF